MSTAWFALLLAGALEVIWALCMKYSDGLTRFWPTAAAIAAIALSFALMSISQRQVPFGTAYALWTGMGAAGSIVAGILLFQESADLVRLSCLALIIVGMVGLKLATPE